MLHAIENKKAGQNFSSGEINWRQSFKRSEDSLTSSVLGTLMYLPEEFIWPILFRATKCDLFKEIDNKINEVVYWPSWNAKDTTNVFRVEPDVLIRTTLFDLIIEVKREECNQELQQWINECVAYRNEFGKDKKTVIFFALGGSIPFSFDRNSLPPMEIKFIGCKWRELLYSVKKESEEMESSRIQLPGYLSRIFSDINLAFQIHGFYQIEWMSTLLQSGYLNIKTDSLLYFINQPCIAISAPSCSLNGFNISSKSINTFSSLTL